MAGSEDRTGQVRQAERFNEQCFLIDNWEHLANINITSTNNDPYKNFIIIEGEPGLVTHELIGKKGIEELLEIKAEAVSLLLPRIKITKLVYKDQKTKIPEEKVLLFRDHTSPTSIESITRSRMGRGDEVGLKSFSYELAGKNVAEGGIARCTLKIFFQNVSSLVSDAPDKNHAAFKDLIIREPKFLTRDEEGKIISKDRIWNSEHFRIKIESGWSDPVDPTEAIISSDLRKKIQQSRTILFMTLLKHELDFKDDGSVELTLEYQGAMEAALNNRKSDILKLTKDGIKAASIRKKINQQAKEKAKLSKKMPSINKKQSSSAPSFFERGVSALFPSLGDRLAINRLSETKEIKAQQQILQLETNDKQERYSRLLNDLLKTSRLFYVDVDQEHIQGFTDEQKKKLQAAIENKDKYSEKDFRRAQKLQLQRGRRKHGNLKVFLVDSEGRDNSSIAQAKKDILASNLRKKDKTSKRVAKFAKKVRSANANKEKKDSRRINFFFLGDLLEVALKVLKVDRPDLHNMSVLVGPIAFKDPRNPNGPSKIINLADVPISLNLFVTWYMKQVVGSLRTKYYFDKFLKDVINTLVVPALGEDCFVVGQNQQHVVSMTFFSTPGVKVQNNKVRDPLKAVRTKSRTKLSDLKQQTTAAGISSQFTHHNTKELYHYLYIYVSSWRTMDLSGDRTANLKQGIYHLYPASDRGLVKSIKFKKQDQPFVAEMRATQDSEDTKRLRDRYNATVTMIGNSLFRPGMYVYIDTERFGLGSGFDKSKDGTRNNSIAKQLGIGGYFQVRKVSQNLGKDDYETEIDVQWIFAGGEKKSKPVAKIKQDAALKAFSKTKNVLGKKS